MKLTATNAWSKASLVERFQRSIQLRIYKRLTQLNTLNWIDALSDHVVSYNRSIHRTIKPLTPLQADLKVNEVKTRGILLHQHSKLLEKRKKPSPELKLGQIVRVRIKPNSNIDPARRAYSKTHNEEFYKIIHISLRDNIPKYTIQSLEDDEITQGTFYSEELQWVNKDTWKVEKVVKKVGRGQNQKLLVKWVGFGPKYNSYIKASDLTERV